METHLWVAATTGAAEINSAMLPTINPKVAADVVVADVVDTRVDEILMVVVSEILTVAVIKQLPSTLLLLFNTLLQVNTLLLQANSLLRANSLFLHLDGSRQCPDMPGFHKVLRHPRQVTALMVETRARCRYILLVSKAQDATMTDTTEVTDTMATEVMDRIKVLLLDVVIRARSRTGCFQDGRIQWKRRWA